MAAPPGLDFCYFDLVGAMCGATDVSGQHALPSFLVGQRLFRGGTFAPRSENQMVSSITGLPGQSERRNSCHSKSV